jgi:hypothetical protein
VGGRVRSHTNEALSIMHIEMAGQWHHERTRGRNRDGA